MSIYRDHISDALGIRNIFEIYPELSPEELFALPEDAVQSGWSTNGQFAWRRDVNGPMQNHHAQTWRGDERTEAQKEASKKHSKHQKKFAITPTKKGDKLSDEHRQALRKPKKSQSFKEYVCPHCNKSGRGNTMVRWHFDNCKHNK